MSKFDTIVESVPNEDGGSTDYEDTLSTLNKKEMIKFLKSADLPYDSVDFKTFGDIVIKISDCNEVHDILIGVDQLEGYTIRNNASDNEVTVKAKLEKDNE